MIICRNIYTKTSNFAQCFICQEHKGETVIKNEWNEFNKIELYMNIQAIWYVYVPKACPCIVKTCRNTYKETKIIGLLNAEKTINTISLSINISAITQLIIGWYIHSIKNDIL